MKTFIEIETVNGNMLLICVDQINNVYPSCRKPDSVVVETTDVDYHVVSPNYDKFRELLGIVNNAS